MYRRIADVLPAWREAERGLDAVTVEKVDLERRIEELRSEYQRLSTEASGPIVVVSSSPLRTSTPPARTPTDP